MPEPSRQQTKRAKQLHVCPECESPLVQPVQWQEARPGFWELTLLCPNCHWFDEGVFSQREVDGLEEHLDDGLAKMLNDLRRLTQANMAEEIDRFTAHIAAFREVLAPKGGEAVGKRLGFLLQEMLREANTTQQIE